MLIVNAEVDGRAGQAIRVDGAVVSAVGDLAPRPGEEVVDARGGLLLPGLRDHHIHLLALAALAASVPVGPPAVRTAEQFAAALRRVAARAAPGAWVRAVGYHESVAGDLDREALDRVVADVPVRVQHRSGALWTVNTPGLAALRAAAAADGAARALGGDGRLFRADDRLGRWLERAGAGSRVGTAELAAVGSRLAAYGITGVTDATATTGPAQVATLAAAAGVGALPQHVTVTGPADLDVAGTGLRRGPVKIVLDDDLPAGLDDLAETVRRARAGGRRVAVHCVTRVQLALALALFDAGGGTVPGDRIEHAGVLPPEMVPPLVEAGLTVVTQPHFLAERGDAYLRDVDPDDVPWLYRGAGLLRAGVPLAAGTDAPFGGEDPWASMRAAVHRRAPSGTVLGAAEALTPGRALALYLGEQDDPGGPPRRVAVGAPADLCLLGQPGAAVLADLDPGPMLLTVVDGKPVHTL